MFLLSFWRHCLWPQVEALISLDIWLTLWMFEFASLFTKVCISWNGREFRWYSIESKSCRNINTRKEKTKMQRKNKAKQNKTKTEQNIENKMTFTREAASFSHLFCVGNLHLMARKSSCLGNGALNGNNTFQAGK